MSSKKFSDAECQSIRSHLAKLANPLEITLTIDPVQFTNPLECYEWVKDNRRLPEFIRTLYRYGKLLSQRYVWALEFQGSGWPHWHIVVDAKTKSRADPSPYIHIPVLKSTWGIGHIFARQRTPERQAAYLLKEDQKSAPVWASGLKIHWFGHDRTKGNAP